MGKHIPIKIRDRIIKDRQEGKSYAWIASCYDYSVSGVKKIWYRYVKEGAAGLETRYKNCGQGRKYDTSIRQLIEEQRSGAEGAPYIRSVLEEKYPDRRIPHERTIQRWWKSKGSHRPKGRRGKAQASWTRYAHQVWQIDGKEQIELGNGQLVSWLNIVDEGSKAELLTQVSPLENNDRMGSKNSHSDGQLEF